MKKAITYLFAISALLVACNKTEIDTNEANDGIKEYHIRAIGEEIMTKTYYTLNEGKYNFSWHADDKIGVQTVKKDDSSLDMSTFTNTSAAGAIADFTAAGTATHDLGNYAFYPCRYPSDYNYFTYDGKNIYYSVSQTDLSYLKTGTAIADQTEADAATKATVRLFGTITEDAEKPMRHIPLIGIRKGETTDYSFKAATGVLKITLNDLPATATQIRLDATDYALNGYFVFDTNGEIKESYKKEGYGLKYLNITTTGDAERAFYFPIPTGTIPAGKLTVSVMAGANKLYAVTNKQDIVLTRGEITELPTISIKSPAITISGTSSAPTLAYDKDGLSSVVKFCACISNSASNNFANYPTGLCFSTASGSYNIASWDGDGKLTASGKYYLHWVAVSASINANTLTSLNDSRIKAYGVIPFYFLSSTDAALLGHYTHATEEGCKAGGSEVIPNPASFTIVVSDNPLTGNMMVSEFDGMTCIQKVPGIYDPVNTKVTWDNFNKPFDTDSPVKRFARSSGMDTKLNFVFTLGTPNTFYADVNFGYVTGNYPAIAWSWKYYYNAGSGHVYTQE